VRHRPGRTAVVAAAVAVSVALVTVLAALYHGLIDANQRYLRTLEGDVVVSEAGAPLVTTLLQTSRLPPATVEAVRHTAGVARVRALHGRLVSLAGGRDRYVLVYLVGLRPPDTFAAPVAMVAGRARPQVGEIVVDEVLAHDLGQGVGGTVAIGQATLRIAGIARGGNAVLGTYAFVHEGALELSIGADPAYLFVTADRGVGADALADALAAVPGVRAVPRTRFLEEKQAPFRQMVLPVVALVVVVAAGAGGLVVAATLLADAFARREEYGVLAALGISTARLAAAALAEAAVGAGLGVALGLAAGALACAALTHAQPRFVTVLPIGVAAVIALAAVVVAAVATLLPIRLLARLDPAEVFRV